MFDRNSVVLECLLWQKALERARSESFTLDELKEFTANGELVTVQTLQS